MTGFIRRRNQFRTPQNLTLFFTNFSLAFPMVLRDETIHKSSLVAHFALLATLYLLKNSAHEGWLTWLSHSDYIFSSALHPLASLRTSSQPAPSWKSITLIEYLNGFIHSLLSPLMIVAVYLSWRSFGLQIWKASLFTMLQIILHTLFPLPTRLLCTRQCFFIKHTSHCFWNDNLCSGFA